MKPENSNTPKPPHASNPANPHSPSSANGASGNFGGVEKWRCELLAKLLGWGTAIVILLAGWALGREEEVFDIWSCGSEGGRKECHAAIGLIFLAVPGVCTWAAAVISLRGRVSDGEFPFTKKQVKRYAAAMCLAVFAVVLLAVI